MGKLREKLSSWVDSLLIFFVANSAIALILATLGLDAGFIGHFLTRIQSPLVVALLAASFATTLAAAWLDKDTEVWNFQICIIGTAAFAFFFRAILTLYHLYVPILSPLTLAPLLWVLWPACAACMLSTGPLSAWSTNPAVQLGLVALAIVMCTTPAMMTFASRQFRERGSQRRKEAEEHEVMFKGATTVADYVSRVAAMPDRGRAIKMLEHDMRVAMKYGDSFRANEILKTINYIELQDALGLPLDPGRADWRKEAFEKRRKKSGEAQKVGEDAERARLQGAQRAEKELEAERREAERLRREAGRRELLDDLKSLKLFEDVVGLEDVKEEIVWSFLLPLFFPEEAEGVKPSGGILIYGPTGTGKTEVMKALLDACRRLDIQVLEAKPSDVLSKWVGETEQNIRNLFEKAREKPTVLFIDEADGLLARREDWEGSHEHRALKEFLQQMDGLKENDKILVIACTNEPWKIAEPALRPGRLGTHFYAPPPNDKERAELFTLFLRGMRVEGEVDCNRLAELTKPSQRGHYCGADIRAICERAYIIALQSGRKALTMADLEAAAARTQPSISTVAVHAFENFMGRYTPSNKQPPSTEYVR